MRSQLLRLVALSSISTLGACADEARAPAGPEVAIDVAPLTLPGTLGVSYAIAVYNQDPTPYTGIFDVTGDAVMTTGLVWHQEDVTSNQFGNGPGGDISYVGPCDASVDENWVALALNRVDVGDGNGSYDGAAGAFPGTANLLDDQNSAFTASPGSNDLDPDFVNPAPYNDALVLKFPCEENEDTRVTFNLTVMRDAQQGFFDVAVNFEDIFCSMKIDTCYDDGPITLLFGDEEGEGRVETAVIASACTAGTDDADTIMWMSPLEVSCDGGVTFTLDPTGGATESTAGEQGNQSCVQATGTTAGTKATGTASFLTQALGGVTIPAGTECAPVVIIGGTPTYGPRFTLDAAANPFNNVEGRVTVDVTAVDEGAARAASFSGYVHCFHTDPQTAYAETQLTATGGSDPTTGDTYDLCYALYWGEEDLECDPPGVPCNKGWWNVAIDIDALRDQGLTNCNVTTAITASSSTDVSPPTFVNGTLPGPGQTYGYVAFDAELTDGNGAPTCFQGPMGSDYAAVKYGATKDMLGGEPFPQLCANIAQGDASPKQLKDIGGYFFDERAELADARYIGSVTASANSAGQLVSYKRVRAEFAEMGAGIGGKCGSTTKNNTEILYFDVKSDADPAAPHALYWRGIGDATVPLVGEYTVQAYGWDVDTWVALGDPTQHDFATTERDGKKSNLITFAEGAAVSTSHDRIAIALTRDDLGPVEDIRIAFGFVGGFTMEDTDSPPFIFALCSYETLECTCHDTSGDLGTCEPDADTDTYWY